MEPIVEPRLASRPSQVREPCQPREVFPDVEVAGNRLQMFTESPPWIEALLADVRSATQRVWIESYTISADAVGTALAEALKERSRAGVDCRLMFDAVGSYGVPESYFADLRQSGVEVHGYHSLWNVLWKFASLRPFNRRNHRKLAVIDDRVAHFGGMNLVDQSGIETIEDVKARDLPISAGWRDVQVRLSGPAQAEVAEAFDRLWMRMHHERGSRWPRWRISEMLACRRDALFFFDSRPRFKFRRPARVLAPLIRQAQRSITLSMAYFIPVGSVLRELLRARRRGVTVRVIVPGQSDVRLVQWASRHMYEKLLRSGIRIFEREDQMLHSKVMVIDGVWSVIGSCNLDPRSLWLNLEFLSVIRSKEMAAAVSRICAYEMRNSRRVSLRQCRQRPWHQRFLDRLAWSFRRWL